MAISSNLRLSSTGHKADQDAFLGEGEGEGEPGEAELPGLGFELNVLSLTLPTQHGHYGDVERQQQWKHLSERLQR